MIKIERTSVMNFENAIRGARNPMNSWGRMDSHTEPDGTFVFGENDKTNRKAKKKNLIVSFIIKKENCLHHS